MVSVTVISFYVLILMIITFLEFDNLGFSNKKLSSKGLFLPLMFKQCVNHFPSTFSINSDVNLMTQLIPIL